MKKGFLIIWLLLGTLVGFGQDLGFDNGCFGYTALKPIPRADTSGVDLNNYDLEVHTNLWLHATTDIAVTGFVGYMDGYKLYVVNNSTNTITLKHNSTSSSVGNRIITPSGTDHSLLSGHEAYLQYFNNEWRLLIQN